MVTSAFIFSFLFLTVLLAFFDMFLYAQTYIEAIKNLLVEEFSSAQLLILPAIIGVLSSLIIDIRFHKNKKRRKVK